MSFLFMLNQLSLQYIRDVVYLILCLCYPFFICMKLEMHKLKKIAFGIWILLIMSACIYDIAFLERNERSL
ncbi:unnamed protein product [Blepharisma stoltei]|uniref:Uncharacterized protein n=1 Tax=Blepharisma stoltei TaxID=1481888 RepID=A0AAU9IR89_9CILI|nr:unnamed protein product [Blepharisma stoltei]